MIDKHDLQSPDKVNENLEKIAQLFPNCVTEGAERKVVDFDLLKQELNHAVVEGDKERYRLEWPGKKEAIVTANLPTTKTLRPISEDSVDFDNTENLYIEGDNLEVLKLLQESYLGKIKMIYIDPPYNTGKDFVYKDNFNHSDWLNMMYPRIKLARNLLSTDGAILLSIDENESANLKKILEEIFGENNFIGEMMVVRAEGGGLAKQMIKGHDTLFAYAKNITQFKPLLRPKIIRGKKEIIKGEEYWIEEDWLRKEFGKYGTCPYNEIEKWHGIKKKKEIDAGIEKGLYKLISKKGIQIVGRYRKISEDGSKFYSILKHLNKNGVQDLMNLGLEKYFDFPKPVSLLKEIILGGTFYQEDKDAIILDFFAGSCSTAEAVLSLNASDNGHRKFIQVQLPLETDKKSEAYKAGYQNICEIGKERIRRAAKKIKEESGADIDYGFRVYRLDSSNMD